MTRSCSRWIRHLISIAILGAVAGRVDAIAATPITPSCGDTIGPGGSYALTGDLGPCGAGVALIVDSASLDLRGHEIYGDGTSFGVGVRLTGVASRLSNGTLRSFGDIGLVIMGQGLHVIRKIVSRENGFDGFAIRADGNILRGCEAIDNGNDGFDLLGASNLVRGGLAQRNGTHGFNLDGTDNRLTRNRAIENGADGFHVRGIDFVLVNNRAERNGRDGFRGNGRTVLRQNAAFENLGVGFNISQSGSRIVENRARQNATADARDSFDACISNVWARNNFGPVIPSCIR